MYNGNLSYDFFVYCFNDQVPMMVVGNKADMKKRAVSKQEGKTLADEFGADFIEVSVSMIDCIYIL